LSPAARAAARAPLLSGVRLSTQRPYSGDGSTLATIGVVSGRDAARLHFVLHRPARVVLDTLVTGQGSATERLAADIAQESVGTRIVKLPAGPHTVEWTPDVALQPRTYILRLQAQDATGAQAEQRSTVRLLGVDAGFGSLGAAPGDNAVLSVRTDAEQLTIQFLHSGPEKPNTYANDEIKGVPVTDPITIDWARNIDQPASIRLRIGDWPSGVYAARLQADDGRVGFAPIVVRPVRPKQRVAVVIPTSTWQAYNFYDADGDGWGDTWYARWGTKNVDPTRPHANRGVPYRYRSYDLQFLRWLAAGGRPADFYADKDIERFPSVTALRAAYDLLVFPGHTEYVTTRLYDLVTGFRDSGGNLMFLSANNFFRRIDRGRRDLLLVDEWRSLGRPEAALCGVQYLASDRGERHAPFTVTGARDAPWAFRGTGLGQGDQFGLYGIEIDARAASSPSDVQVLARIPDLFGAGRSAEMTYYEHESGARVFSAGALNFGGQMLLWPETTRIVQNVWKRLANP
jgi:N,N-dimethylformamidase beta subunit-like protein